MSAPRSAGGPASAPKISIVVPYRDRVDNLRLSLASLADQTLGADRFEVVLGVMEHSPQYLEVCREYADRLDIVSVLSSRPWQVGYARNLAMRQATGEILVLMDVDMALPPGCLQRLYERHFAYGQRVCVVGQMIDYDNNTGDVAEVDVLPYEHYRKILDDLEAGGPVRADPRVDTPNVIPWAFAWTALIALPRAVVTAHDLAFDHGFHGYGVEDLEWAYRVCRSGTPVVMGHDFFGVHLPHVRSVAANKRTEAGNYRYFLRKWPGTDVELACAFGDFEANAEYLEFAADVERASGTAGGALGVVVGVVDGQLTLAVGARLGPGKLLSDPDAEAVFGAGAAVEVLPIAGLCLPYEDGAVQRCQVLPAVAQLAPRYRERILAEVHRVSARPAR